MAIRSKAPSTPAKRAKNTPERNTPTAAPPKAKAKRDGGAAKQPGRPSAATPDASMEATVQEQVFEAPAEHLEQRPTAEAAAAETGAAKPGMGQREDRASRALDAIKTLGEMISEGIETLAELRAEMREMSGRMDQLAAGMPTDQAGPERPHAAGAEDRPIGRDSGGRDPGGRDPGDAVPPGVAVLSPTPLTKADEAVLNALDELPKRAGRGKRGPRTKA